MLDSILSHFSGVRVRVTKHNGLTEYWVPCPYHGERGNNSFSFSERGFLCFACGEKGGLPKLADRLGIRGQTGTVPFIRPAIRPASPTVYPWQQDPHVLEKFWPVPDVAAKYCLAHGLRWPTIRRFKLGYGYLPACRCNHKRLIVPIFEDGQLTAIKGRAIHADDTDPKWLSAKGSKVALFGGDELYVGCRVIITEAPISAMALMQFSSVVAVAGSGGAATWKAEWTERINRFNPRQVEVWFDNDQAGADGGVKLVNDLLDAGLPARMRGWPKGAPAKYDVADFVAAELEKRPEIPPGIVLL